METNAWHADRRVHVEWILPHPQRVHVFLEVGVGVWGNVLDEGDGAVAEDVVGGGVGDYIVSQELEVDGAGGTGECDALRVFAIEAPGTGLGAVGTVGEAEAAAWGGEADAVGFVVGEEGGGRWRGDVGAAGVLVCRSDVVGEVDRARGVGHEGRGAVGGCEGIIQGRCCVGCNVEC